MRKKRMLSTVIALLLVFCLLPVSAFAAEYDLSEGSVSVSADSSGQTVTHGSNAAVPDDAPVIIQSGTGSTSNTVSISAAEGSTANVTFRDVNIDVSEVSYDVSDAAVSTSGAGDVTIELTGENTVKSGTSRAGLEKCNEGKLTITDEDNNGKLTATGGNYAAGIGGGDSARSNSNGRNIVITGGTVTAQGGNYGAGIGGGYGEGRSSPGSNITITGGDVTATGGNYASGIGGGWKGDGSDITVTGSTVTATGGTNGAGIGGGMWSSGSNITISGDAHVTAQSGERDSKDGTGAAIGNGGYREGSYPNSISVDGEEVEPDTSGLSPTGKVTLLNPDGTVKRTITGTVQPTTEAEPTIETETGSEMVEPLYRVTDKDGRSIAHKSERKDGVLTVAVDDDFAILTGRLSGIDTLERQGVEKIVFATSKATSTFKTADLLEKGMRGDTYELTHNDETVTFVVSEKETDVKDILVKP